jgi:tetratricopeptide (TPR) repeat protein
MSTNNKPDNDIMLCCASCGVAEVDDIKLKTCTACKLVRYCSVKCQKAHRPRHEQACKKRAAELRDEILFRQPESSHYGDCPICLLPLSLDTKQSMMQSCCSKMICLGCDYANKIREMEDRLQYKCPIFSANWKRELKDSLDQKCPFCRHPGAKTQAESDILVMKRVRVNDPFALREVGTTRCEKGDYKGAIEYWMRAAELGDAEANYQLSVMYREGRGVDRDEKKELHHLTEAAISGDPSARHNLACYEWRNGRYERAAKHWIIAANLGNDKSVEALKEGYVTGFVSKEDFAAALRAHQAAVDATKSPQREAAEAASISLLNAARGGNK